MTDDGVKTLLWVLHQAQLGLAAFLEILGVSSWPFSHRLAAEQLLFDRGQAARVVWAALVIAALLLILAVALWWRKRPRRLLVLGALAILIALLTPWPIWRLLLTPTVPTAFHASAVPFTASAVMQGRQLYQAHCLRCHGALGDGDGVEADKQAIWPPTLNRSILWRRFEGELFWSVRHGMTDRHGAATMPAADALMTDEQIWMVLGFIRAQAAGQSLKREGVWEFPVALPDEAVRCAGRGPSSQRLDALRGQTVRLVFAGDTMVREDPRMVTVSVGETQGIDCTSDSAEMRRALSILLGVEDGQLGGYQILVDRQGWLRAQSKPGSSGWSEDDLVCRTADALQISKPASEADGLQALIRRMDAEPVRAVVAGFSH